MGYQFFSADRAQPLSPSLQPPPGPKEESMLFGHAEPGPAAWHNHVKMLLKIMVACTKAESIA